MDTDPYNLTQSADKQINDVRSSPIIGIDFFCGAGGMTRGFLDAGIDILCGVDTDVTAKDTYENNNIRSNGTACSFLCRCVESLSRQEMTRIIGNRGSRALVFIGCAPCQPFTNLNTSKENQGKSKNLLSAFLWQIRRFRPEYVVVENVPGIQADKYGGVFDKFVERLIRLGYCYPDYHVLDAKKYGVPQTRRRMVLITSLLGKIYLPVETHGPSMEPYVTVRDTIKKYPIIRAGSSHKVISNHQSACISDLNKGRLRVGRTNWTEEMQVPCYGRTNGYGDVYCRMLWDRPAPALTTRFNSISNGRFGHPSQLRGISIREGAALQTFPDSYVFQSTFTRNAKHIGNAVPVNLAKILAKTIIMHYDEHS